MLHYLLIKPITDKIVKECNRYIRRTVDDYFTNFPEVQTFAKAVGAHSLAVKLCDRIGIDPLEIERPEIYLDYLRKEKYANKNTPGSFSEPTANDQGVKKSGKEVNNE